MNGDSKQVIEQVAPHSCELTTNAKGRVQASVKVYHEDAMEAAERAVAVLNWLKVKLGDEMASS